MSSNFSGSCPPSGGLTASFNRSNICFASVSKSSCSFTKLAIFWFVASDNIFVAIGSSSLFIPSTTDRMASNGGFNLFSISLGSGRLNIRSGIFLTISLAFAMASATGPKMLSPARERIDAGSASPFFAAVSYLNVRSPINAFIGSSSFNHPNFSSTISINFVRIGDISLDSNFSCPPAASISALCSAFFSCSFCISFFSCSFSCFFFTSVSFFSISPLSEATPAAFVRTAASSSMLSSISMTILCSSSSATLSTRHASSMLFVFSSLSLAALCFSPSSFNLIVLSLSCRSSVAAFFSFSRTCVDCFNASFISFSSSWTTSSARFFSSCAFFHS